MVSIAEEDAARKDQRRRNLEIIKYGYAVRINHQRDLHAVDADHRRLSEDAILTGLCQLLALRLQCSNAFVCLDDSTRQHVIAEATQTISPYDSSVHATGDGLMFGVQSFDHTFGITSVTMPAYTKGSRHFVSNCYTSVTDRGSIFLDLGQEPLLEHLPFMRFSSTSQFYAETPLRNGSGVVVGTVGVLDSKPRSDFGDVNMPVMLDSARMIMEYLELLRLKDSHSRAEHLLQGLGHFNGGQSRLTPWIAHQPVPTGPDSGDGNRPPGPRSAFIPLQLEHIRSNSNTIPSMNTPSTQPERYFSSSSTTQPTEIESTKPSDRESSVRTTSRTLDIVSPASDSLKRPTSIHTIEPMEPEAQPLPGQTDHNIGKAFARATNLIREAMDLDATCFLDVSHHTLSGPRYTDKQTTSGRTTDNNAEAHATNSGDDASALTASDSDGRVSSQSSWSSSESEMQSGPVICKQIAFSTKTASSLEDNAANSLQAKIPEKSILSLTSMYPAGHVFQFDSLGLLSSSDDSDPSQKPGLLRSRRHKIAQMLSFGFPKARSLLFMPLYDNEQKRLYCVFFGWISDPSRVLDEDDAMYVSGFANSIMCEIMRLEILALDKAKTVFMSSISHELRSPLHGILGAAELLRESKLDSDQNELSLMVDSCGRTLLDIVNNLLEHSRINSKVDEKSIKRRHKRHSVMAPSRRAVGGQADQTNTPVVDLVELTEDTVVSVVSGHAIRTLRAEQISTRMRKPVTIVRDIETTQIQELRAPTVVLDIQKQDSWCFRMDAGSWRRIVMNLVGNALKYTTSGHVVVSMCLGKGSKKPGRPPQHAILTVSDTGQGISEKYLKDKLYTPFSQENQLSAGVGLGLSIVHRLVTGLGGKISIRSEMDIGTDIRLSIPLVAFTPEQDFARAMKPGVMTNLHARLAVDMSICLCGFDILPALDSPPTGTMGSYAAGLLKLKQSLSMMASKWFGIAVTSSITTASVCLVEASYAAKLLQENPTHEIWSKRYILVTAYDTDKYCSKDWPGQPLLMGVPIGPIKMARLLNTALQQQEVPHCGTAHSLPARKKSEPAEPAEPAVLPKAAILAAHSQSQSQPQPQSMPNVPQQRNDRVLLVDDNDINLRILATLVRKLKLAYGTASNGQEALDAYMAGYESGEPYTHIFMDISMPVMDGLTSTRRIRAYEEDKKSDAPCQIFALTGLGHIDTQNEAIACGVDQYFRKPVRLDILRSVLSPKT